MLLMPLLSNCSAFDAEQDEIAQLRTDICIDKETITMQ